MQCAYDVHDVHLMVDGRKVVFVDRFDGKITRQSGRNCARIPISLSLLYAQGMRSLEQYDEICKCFTEGKQRDNDANEIQKHLQLYDLSLGEYLVNKYALWLDFRTIDENELATRNR